MRRSTIQVPCAASAHRVISPRIGLAGRSRLGPYNGPGEPPPGLRSTSRDAAKSSAQQIFSGVGVYLPAAELASDEALYTFKGVGNSESTGGRESDGDARSRLLRANSEIRTLSSRNVLQHPVHFRVTPCPYQTHSRIVP